MFDFLKKILGTSTTSVDYKNLVRDGALILDVRSKGEFESGHIKGAINIPVDQLKNNLAKLKDKQKAIITCCASGMRSSSAKAILQGSGYTNVYNGGGWSSLQDKLL